MTMIIIRLFEFHNLLKPIPGSPMKCAVPAIALGGLLDADRVAEMLGKKVSAMDPGSCK